MLVPLPRLSQRAPQFFVRRKAKLCLEISKQISIYTKIINMVIRHNDTW